jgi:hypothetical protein
MRRARGIRLVINWILLVMILLVGLAKIAVALNEKTMREGQEKYLPVEIAAYLDKTPPEGKMFNSYNWGGYLMFAAPHVPVYVDGRTDLYDDAFLRDYLDVTMTRDGWEEALDDIGFVVIESNSLLATTLRRSDAWQEQQFDDGRSSLFTRIDES